MPARISNQERMRGETQQEVQYLPLSDFSRSSSLAIPSSIHVRSSACNSVDVSEWIQYVAKRRSIVDFEFNSNDGANVPERMTSIDQRNDRATSIIVTCRDCSL